jgi:type IV pilus assembly protein PilM
LFFKSKRVIGLDIGSSSVKIAELQVNGGAAELLGFAVVPTPTAAIQGGDIANSSALAQAVQSGIAKLGTKTKDVCTGMWGTAVIVKRISIPKVDRKMLLQQVRFESEQYIPFDLKEIALSYHVINDDAQGNTMEILLVAAQNALVAQYANLVRGAGLQIKILDVSDFALANCFEFNYGKARNQAIALVNIGASTTNFVVIHNGEVIFARDLPVGGNYYTNEIHKEMGITVAEAESLKLGASAKGEVPPEVNTIITTANDMITEEIRNSFDFFSASVSGVQISRCFYTGGASQMTTLINQIAKATNIGFAPINPFQKIKPAKKLGTNFMQQIAPLSSIALGLGMRTLGDWE